jgi:hypothetical protein
MYRMEEYGTSQLFVMNKNGPYRRPKHFYGLAALLTMSVGLPINTHT